MSVIKSRREFIRTSLGYFGVGLIGVSSASIVSCEKSLYAYYVVNPDTCEGKNNCGKCIDVCSYSAITFTEQNGKQQRAYIDQKACMKCGKCEIRCPYNAIQD